MKERFISSTIGMNLTHPAYEFSKLTRFEFYETKKGIKISTVSGHNLGRMKKIKNVFITKDEYDNRDFDYYDDTVEFYWTAIKVGYELNDDFDFEG